MASELAHTPHETSGLPARRSGRHVRLYFVALGALVAFAALAVAAVHDPARSADESLFRELYTGEWLLAPGTNRSDDALDSMLPLFSRAADARAIALACFLVVVALLVRRDRRDAVFFVLALIPVAAASILLADALDRAGPYPVEGVGSFPSGHAALSMAAVAAIVCLARGKARLVATAAGAAFVFGVGFAVIADGGHWPSDVVGGWLLAIAWVTALWAYLGGGRASGGAIPLPR